MGSGNARRTGKEPDPDRERITYLLTFNFIYYGNFCKEI